VKKMGKRISAGKLLYVLDAFVRYIVRELVEVA
jgi:hypothetical protein